MIAQLNKLILNCDKYEQNQAIAHAYKKVENANLKGLYQALTLNTCVLLVLVSSKNKIENTKQMSPK
jgi:hypothetical protein